MKIVQAVFCNNIVNVALIAIEKWIPVTLILWLKFAVNRIWYISAQNAAIAKFGKHGNIPNTLHQICADNNHWLCEYSQLQERHCRAWVQMITYFSPTMSICSFLSLRSIFESATTMYAEFLWSGSQSGLKTFTKLSAVSQNLAWGAPWSSSFSRNISRAWVEHFSPWLETRGFFAEMQTIWSWSLINVLVLGLLWESALEIYAWPLSYSIHLNLFPNCESHHWRFPPASVQTAMPLQNLSCKKVALLRSSLVICIDNALPQSTWTSNRFFLQR